MAAHVGSIAIIFVNLRWPVCMKDEIRLEMFVVCGVCGRTEEVLVDSHCYVYQSGNVAALTSVVP